MESNKVKNPNWQEARPVGYLQVWPRIWTRTTQKQIQLAVRAGLELGVNGLQVQRSNQSSTLPPPPTNLVSNQIFQPVENSSGAVWTYPMVTSSQEKGRNN